LGWISAFLKIRVFQQNSRIAAARSKRVTVSKVSLATLGERLVSGDSVEKLVVKNIVVR